MSERVDPLAGARPRARRGWPTFLQRLPCWFGVHDWYGDSENLLGEASGRLVVIVWWECPICGVTKLKHISR